MRRALGILLFALILGQAAHPRAELPPDGPARLTAAYAAFEERARLRRAEGGLPRLSDRGDAAILERLWDAPAILGTPPYASGDVAALLETFRQSVEVYKTYALFTAKAGVPPDPARNLVAYQDEIVRAFAFCGGAVAATVTALSDFVARLRPEQMTETRRKGLRQMRLGVTQMVSGMMQVLSSPDLRPDNAMILVDGLARHADAIARATPAGDRATILATVRAALPALTPQGRERAAPLLQAMADAPCTGLCAID